MGQFSVMDFHAQNSFMPRHFPSAEVNSAIQKYCQRGPSFANGDQELFTSEVIVFSFETKGTQKHCLVKNVIDLYATCLRKPNTQYIDGKVRQVGMGKNVSFSSLAFCLTKIIPFMKATYSLMCTAAPFPPDFFYEERGQLAVYRLGYIRK